MRQIQYTCQHNKATPQHKKSGRKGKLADWEVDRIINYLRTSRQTRQMTAQQITQHFYPEGEIHWRTIKKALNKRGMKRHVALRKPKLSDENKRARLEWCLTRQHWGPEDWSRVLWSDETWISTGKHRKTRVWRFSDEALNDSYLVDKIKKKSWMFWGCFHGSTQGPHLFWDRKNWGTITEQSYCLFVVLIIANYIAEQRRLGNPLFFMQDNALGHAAKGTIALLEELGVSKIPWPANSPDLNPIETLWNIMKDWIAKYYPDYTASLKRTQEAVEAAWRAIGAETMAKLIEEMPQRIQAVIAAQGGHIPY